LKQPFTASDLTERVTLRRYIETINEYGTIERVATSLGTVWALVRPMSGRERDRAQQTEARADYLVVLRNRDDLTEKDVVVWRGAELNIRFIKERGPRALFLEIEAEKNAP
jgi:SPP1 family predicted phage head-tail adaptor